MPDYKKIVLTDIRFWIFLFFILRLLAITDPPLEVAHNWRQTTVTMAARNFLETDANIFFPRIDIAGEKSGIAGMEFPLLNYLVYLVSLVFGYAHWYGRLINLIVSSIGLFYFYKLVLKYFDRGLAFNATFVLLVSVWLNYSRKIMPDTFSASLVLIGIYYGTNYLDRQKSFKNLLLFFIACLMGVLSKLPAGYLLIVFLFFMVDKKNNYSARVTITVAGSLICGLVAGYYFYWVPYLVNAFGCDHFFMGKSFIDGMKDIGGHISAFAQKFYEEALGYTGFIFCIVGTAAAIRKNKRVLLQVSALLLAGFLLVVFKAGSVFYNHAYYVVPFAPVMALLSGYGIQQIENKKLIWSVLIIVAVENIATRFSDYHINPDNIEIVHLEKDLDNYSGRNDLVLINSGNVPTPMYFAHRKGWVNTNDAISDTGYISTLKSKGLKYIIILKKTFGKDLKLGYTQVFENQAYRIYKI